MSKVNLGDKNAWVIAIDMRKKTLLRFSAERTFYFHATYRPCALFKYLNITLGNYANTWFDIYYLQYSCQYFVLYQIKGGQAGGKHDLVYDPNPIYITKSKFRMTTCLLYLSINYQFMDLFLKTTDFTKHCITDLQVLNRTVTCNSCDSAVPHDCLSLRTGTLHCRRVPCRLFSGCGPVTLSKMETSSYFVYILVKGEHLPTSQSSIECIYGIPGHHLGYARWIYNSYL